jgi:hypothetical protein
MLRQPSAALVHLTVALIAVAATSPHLLQKEELSVFCLRQRCYLYESCLCTARCAHTVQHICIAVACIHIVRYTLFTLCNQIIKQLGRVLRVDHVEKYRLPKELQDKEDALDDVSTADVTNGDTPKPSSTTGTWQPGHAYIGKELKGSHSLSAGVDVWAPQVLLLIVYKSIIQ